MLTKQSGAKCKLHIQQTEIALQKQSMTSWVFSSGHNVGGVLNDEHFNYDSHTVLAYDNTCLCSVHSVCHLMLNVFSESPRLYISKRTSAGGLFVVLVLHRGMSWSPDRPFGKKISAFSTVYSLHC